MRSRTLYLVRHGLADALGGLTDAGRRQMDRLGQRLAVAPVDAVWHSPLPRAAECAFAMARRLPGVPVAEAAELVDHVPYVPPPAQTPRSWVGFFDGYDEVEAAEGARVAEALVARFGGVGDGVGDGRLDRAGRHEVLIPHAYPIAWLVRDALGAPPGRWLSLTTIGNAALTVIEHHEGLPPTLVIFNDLTHLPPDLRWTGFRTPWC